MATAAPAPSIPSATGASIANTFASTPSPYAAPKTPTTSTPPAVKPTLTANFSTPVATAPKAPPAVITSKPAEEHLANAKTQLATLSADTANQKAAATPSPTPSTPTDQSGTPATPSIDDQISGLLSDLDTNLTTSKASADTATSDVEKQLADTQAQDMQAAATATTKLQEIASGTYPLSDAEQGLLSSTIASFQAALTAQTTANQAFTGRMAETLASLGIDQSAPTEAAGLIYATISTGASKLADIGTKMATAVSNLHLKLQTQDYNEVQKAWADVSKAFSDRTTALTKMQTEIATAAKNAQTEAINTAKTNITAIVDSAKLSATDKKNAADTLYKQGLLDAKTYSNITARIKAESAPGNNKPPPDTVITTENWLNNTRGTDGYVDPNAYKQAFDGWIADGHQAKDFVKNYPPKTFVNPTNSWLPAYLESKTSTAAATSGAAATNPF